MAGHMLAFDLSKQVCVRSQTNLLTLKTRTMNGVSDPEPQPVAILRSAIHI